MKRITIIATTTIVTEFQDCSEPFKIVLLSNLIIVRKLQNLFGQMSCNNCGCYFPEKVVNQQEVVRNLMQMFEGRTDELFRLLAAAGITSKELTDDAKREGLSTYSFPII